MEALLRKLTDKEMDWLIKELTEGPVAMYPNEDVKDAVERVMRFWIGLGDEKVSIVIDYHDPETVLMMDDPRS